MDINSNNKLTIIMPSIGLVLLVLWVLNFKEGGEIEFKELHDENYEPIEQIESNNTISRNIHETTESRFAAQSENQESEILECHVPNSLTIQYVNSEEIRQNHIEKFFEDSIINQSQEMEAMKVLFETIDNENSRVEGLQQLLHVYPDNEFIGLNLLAACLNIEDSHCSGDIAEQIGTPANFNAFAWSLISAFYYHNGNEVRASEALIRAGELSSYDDQFSELLAYQQVGFESVSNVEASFLMMEALAFSADFRSNHLQRNMDFCRENAIGNPEIKNACLNLGNTVVENAGSSVDTQFGFSILGETHMAVGEVSDYVNTRIAFEEYQDRYMGDEFVRASNLATHDPVLMNSWYQTLINSGEPEAANYLIREAESLSANPSYNPCKE